MRLSTTQIFQQGISAILDQQGRLSKVQEQLSTGKRIVNPSDDPSGSVRSLELQRAIDTTDQYVKNSDQAYTRLQLEETTLSQMNETLQRIRELAVQANNDSQDDESRAGVAVEISQRLEELLGLANTRDSNGEYIFAGYQSQGTAVTRDASGNFVYNGDQNPRYLQISSVRQIALGDAGSDVFFSIPDGNGTFSTAPAATNTGNGAIDTGSLVDVTAWVEDDYTISFTGPGAYEVLDGGGASIATGTFQSGVPISFNGVEVTITGQPAVGDTFSVAASQSKDMFGIVQDLQTALTTGSSTPSEKAQFRSTVNRALGELDQAMDRVLEVRADIGGRMNAIDSQRNIHETASLNLQQSLSDIQDLDYAEAISRFNQQLVTLQAAQQTYTQVQGLSLFNYI